MISRTNSDCYAGLFVLKITLNCLHSDEEVTAPDSFNIKDIVRKVLLTLVLGIAKWGKTLDLKMVKDFFQENDDP